LEETVVNLEQSEIDVEPLPSDINKEEVSKIESYILLLLGVFLLCIYVACIKAAPCIVEDDQDESIEVTKDSFDERLLGAR